MRLMIRNGLALLLAVALASSVVATVTEDEWFNERLSADERNDLVERSKNESFAVVAPMVLMALAKYQPFYGINPRGETPWNDERYGKRASDAIYLMAQAVWQHHIRAKDEPAVSDVILSLLKKSVNDREKLYLISAIKNYQWCPDDEQVLRDLCLDDKQHLEIRKRSAEALLRRGDINTQLPLAIEIIRAHKEGSDRCQAFTTIMNFGVRWKELSDKNKRVFLATGFEIIEALPESELRTGYFVAGHLGHFIFFESRGSFAPDPKSPEYRGQNGLKPEFFIQAVKNAIAWHAEHPEATKVD
jgi:hypothetical protein